MAQEVTHALKNVQSFHGSRLAPVNNAEVNVQVWQHQPKVDMLPREPAFGSLIRSLCRFAYAWMIDVTPALLYVIWLA